MATKAKSKPKGEVRQDEGYQPEPYHVDDDETVTCPDCGRMDDSDAKYCDQCGIGLTPTEDYSAKDDENVRCPNCTLMNDDDADYCDQCGIRLAGRHDVEIVGSGEESGAEGGEPGGDMDDAVMTGMTSQRPPRDNLLRARPAGVSVRSAEDSPSGYQLHGYFSQFNTWYEIDSLWEGHFLERVLPGAFIDTIAKDRGGMKVLFDHGMDWSLSMKPLGRIRTLEEREDGPYYEVDLYDTDYNRNFIVPVASGKLMNGEVAGSGLGASMRFAVQEDQWNRSPKKSAYNPDGLPERSIVRARVYEFGPVTFPANEGASAGMRSMSDTFLARLVGDPRFLEDFSERVGARVAARVLASAPDDLRAALQQPRPTAVDPARASRQELLRRRARAIIVTAA